MFPLATDVTSGSRLALDDERALENRRAGEADGCLDPDVAQHIAQQALDNEIFSYVRKALA